MENINTCKMVKNLLVYLKLSTVKIRSRSKRGRPKRKVSKVTETLLKNSSLACIMNKAKYSY